MTRNQTDHLRVRATACVVYESRFRYNLKNRESCRNGSSSRKNKINKMVFMSADRRIVLKGSGPLTRSHYRLSIQTGQLRVFDFRSSESESSWSWKLNQIKACEKITCLSRNSPDSSTFLLKSSCGRIKERISLLWNSAQRAMPEHLT